MKRAITRSMQYAWSILFAIAAASGMTARSLPAQALAPVAIRSLRPDPVRRPNQPAPPDAWFAADKLRHMGASAAIQLMGFGLMRLAGASKRASLVCATTVSVAAGIGKELRDARTGGDPSVRDLVWDGGRYPGRHRTLPNRRWSMICRHEMVVGTPPR